MRVLILGGDGYLGWPTSMNLSACGHEVLAVDSYLRRNLCREQDVKPLFSIPNLKQRAKLWRAHSGKTVSVQIGDLCNWDFMAEVFEEFRPHAVVHYAEQPSAPYSMIDRRAANVTLTNNLSVTFNVIHAIHEYTPQAHLVKLGTMGEYGTPNIDIEEGWINITKNQRQEKFLFPRSAGSLYHTTKILDTDLLWFYVRNWGIRVTDLMQGPVYGVETDECVGNKEIYTSLNYDEIFGTVINRFMVQAIAGYPLTIYGEGGQTRGYLNIKDTLQCIKLAVENPAKEGELRIFNQFVEIFSVNEIAEKVRESGKRLGTNVEINHLTNPRKESENHYYNPVHTGLLDLGLKPHFLTDVVMDNMMKLVMRYKGDVNIEQICRGIKWKK